MSQPPNAERSSTPGPDTGHGATTPAGSAAARSQWPDPVRRAVQFFETVTPESAAEAAHLYAADAWFRDPFNELRGAGAIGRVFTHMFEQVHEPRFAVIDAIVGADEVFLTWDFTFRLRRGDVRRRRRIHGSSHLRFDAQGRIAYHRDYWDAAELYSMLPGIGTLLRWLQRQAAAPSSRT
ncbi:MAG: nuclear transport factor 2 family protein [Burkholderiales bacterium]|nr:MAG: nuclear transport factor 2 family protein [Burkholderiales bacterium]